MTHCSLGRVVSKSRRIVGMATLRTVVSSAAINTAIRTMTSVIQRRGSGAGSSGLVVSSMVVVFPFEACIIQVTSDVEAIGNQERSMAGSADPARTDVEVSTPLASVETELAMLTRTLEGMSRRSTLYRELDRASYVLARTLATHAPVSIT